LFIVLVAGMLALVRRRRRDALADR
jgi:hypothetical protein